MTLATVNDTVLCHVAHFLT